MHFIKLRNFPSIPRLLSIFSFKSWMVVDFCQMLILHLLICLCGFSALFSSSVNCCCSGGEGLYSLLSGLYCFLEHFKVHSKTEGKVQRFPVYPCLHTCTTPSVLNVLHQRGTFVTTDEPPLDTSLSPKVHRLHWGSLLVLYTLWVWTNLEETDH